MSEKRKFLIVLGDKPGKMLSGKDVLQLAIERFVSVCPSLRVITILESAALPAWRDYCSVHNFTVPQSLVPAAFTPFHSVRSALARVPDGAVVILHDGNRPLVSRTLIAGMLRRMEQGERALVPVISLREPLYGGEELLRPAEGLSLVQTPQMYCSEDIKAAYSEAYDMSFSDPSLVAASKKIPLTPVEGERLNFKIVSAADLAVARAVSEHLSPGSSSRF